jgi:uncharacterized protein YdeI (YjbR/CyaY-like superfamily)
MQGSAQGYFDFGCGRCELHATPSCKVNAWRAELVLLREIVSSCGLQETVKWGAACYTHNERNIVLLGAFKNYCVISFFKGSLLKDTKKIFTSPGIQAQSIRQVRYSSVKEVVQSRTTLKAYLKEAIELEKAGAKVRLKKIEEYPLPDELVAALKKNASLKTAFKALTPGRQRGYLIYFSQPKKSETRVARVEKCIPRILQGKGLQD